VEWMQSVFGNLGWSSSDLPGPHGPDD